LAQNVQTQSYDLKFGYARNEFFLVPTSKRVVNDGNNNDAAGAGTVIEEIDSKGKTIKRTRNYDASIEHNDPSNTPEVLSEIQVGGTGKQTLAAGGQQGAGITVCQRLAVGQRAVQSSAALAMMAYDAKTAAAAAGLDRASQSPSDLRTYTTMIDALVSSTADLASKGDEHAKKQLSALDNAAARLRVEPATVFAYTFDNSETLTPLETPLQVPSSFKDAKSATALAKSLRTSTEQLNFALSAAAKATPKMTTLKLASGPKSPTNEVPRTISTGDVAGIKAGQDAMADSITKQLIDSGEFQSLISFYFGK
jgi:hypothetical protein